MADLASMLKAQMESNIARGLDAAVLSGDTATARKMAKEFADLQVASVPATPAKQAPTPADIKKVLETNTATKDWFGIDPRKTAKIMELGRMMDPTRFETPEAFADRLIKTYEEETKAPVKRGTANTDDENEDGEDENEDGEDENEDGEDENEGADEGENRRARRTRRNGTVQPELSSARGSGASNLRRAFETGDIKHLPRAAAEEIRRSAERYTRTSTKEQKAAFIKTAVTTRARRDLIASGKFDAKANKLK